LTKKAYSKIGHTVCGQLRRKREKIRGFIESCHGYS